ncbi:DNA topoisomerase IA, partial [Dysosmobacter welbionis]
ELRVAHVDGRVLLQLPGIAALTAVDHVHALGVCRAGEAHRPVLVRLAHGDGGHEDVPVAVDGAGLVALGAADHDAVSAALHHMHVHVRVRLLAGGLGPVALGVGHGAVHRQVVVLDEGQELLEVFVIAGAVLLVDLIGGGEHGVERIHTHTPLEAGSGLLAQQALHLHLVDEVLRGLVQVGEAVDGVARQAGLHRHQVGILRVLGQSVGHGHAVDGRADHGVVHPVLNLLPEHIHPGIQFAQALYILLCGHQCHFFFPPQKNGGLLHFNVFQVSFACPELHGPRHWARLPRRVRERGNPARLIRRWRRFAGFEAAARFAARSGLEIALLRRWKFSGFRQSHQLIFEDALVHKLQVLSDLRHELHLIQHLGLEVDARRDLDQSHALGPQLEHSPLGDVQNRLLHLHGILAGEGDVLHLVDELLLGALLDDHQLAVLAGSLQALGGEGAAIDHLLGILRNVDEAAGASQTGAELGHVQVAVGCRLRQAQEGHIQAAALVEVKLDVVGDDGHGVGCGAELGAAHGHAGDGAGLHSQGHLVGDALLRRHVGNFFRRAGAQVHNGILGQLHGGPAGDDLLGVQRDGWDGVHGNAELAGQAAVIGHSQALLVILNGSYHNRIHIDTGNCHQFRIQAAALDDFFHLDDDPAAGVLAGLSHGGDVDGADLPVNGAVAVLVGVAGTQEHHIDGERLVEQ